MPEDVSARVRAVIDLPATERRVDRLVASLLYQPGARITSFVLLLSLVLFAAAGPLTAWAFVVFDRSNRLTFATGLLLATLPALLVADGFFLSRLRMHNRRALAVLVATCGARPPARAGEPARCRLCLGPLRGANATVVRCVFCHAANVTGVDLRAMFDNASKSEGDLEAALYAWQKAGAKWRAPAVLAAATAAATVLLLVWIGGGWSW